MPRSVFTRILDALLGEGEFQERCDAIKRKGIHPLVRFTACLRHICYGNAYDAFDENFRIAESTLSKSVKSFCILIKKHFGKDFLNRPPTEEEKKRLFEANSCRGFPGNFASWDCKHFVWNQCPQRWAGQFAGHAFGGRKTLILEAIADIKRYIWYSNFGHAGALNDLNVLDKSSIVGSMINGTFDISCPEYTINGTKRDWFYFLADGIYYDWAIFVKTYSDPIDEKQSIFAARQEAVRKDVECAFGMLVAKFHILANPLRHWYVDDIKNLLDCCIILHNMVVASKGGRDIVLDADDLAISQADNNGRWPLFSGTAVSNEVLLADRVDIFSARSGMFSKKMTSSIEHFKLKNDLKEHLYKQYSTSSNSID